MRDERGMALLVVMVVSVMLGLLGLSMAFDSSNDMIISNEMENRRKAFMAADIGYNIYKNQLRGNELDDILATTTSVPHYINYAEPSASTVPYAYFSRNPVASMEAMNVDFDDPPTPIGTRTVNGLLTPPTGEVTSAGGRHWVKLSDNDDGDADLMVDADGRFYLRVMGIQSNGAGQASTYGGTVKNSIAILEAMLERDLTLDLSAPLTLVGPGVSPASGAKLFDGNAFDMDGYDHPGMTLANLMGGPPPHSTFHAGTTTAAVDAIWDDPGAGDGDGLMTDVCSDLSGPQAGNLDGPVTDPTCGGASIQDATDNVRSDPNPDATNIFDATYMMTFIENMEKVADTKLADGTNASGQSFGTDADPIVTYCSGDCTLGGGGSGSGLLIVRGRLDFNAIFAYHGLILVVGDGEYDQAGSNVGILGGIFVAKTIDNGDDTWSYGTPAITIAGNSNYYLQASGISLGYSLMTLKLLSWREITREIEPAF